MNGDINREQQHSGDRAAKINMSAENNTNIYMLCNLQTFLSPSFPCSRLQIGFHKADAKLETLLILSQDKGNPPLTLQYEIQTSPHLPKDNY